MAADMRGLPTEASANGLDPQDGLRPDVRLPALEHEHTKDLQALAIPDATECARPDPRRRIPRDPSGCERHATNRDNLNPSDRPGVPLSHPKRTGYHV